MRTVELLVLGSCEGEMMRPGGRCHPGFGRFEDVEKKRNRRK